MISAEQQIAALTKRCQDVARRLVEDLTEYEEIAHDLLAVIPRAAAENPKDAAIYEDAAADMIAALKDMGEAKTMFQKIIDAQL